MYGRQGNNYGNSQPPPWLVRAELTIRHGTTPVTSGSSQVPPPPPPPIATTTTTTFADSAGVRMIYRWNTGPSTSVSTSAPSPSAPLNASSASASIPSAGFGFQRGNILFTSTPPSRPVGSFTLPRAGSSDNSSSSRIPDSGYNSEQFSPQSYASLPTRRPSQQYQYNRRCKSTCSIVLATVDTNNVLRPPGNDALAEKRQTSDAGMFSSRDPWIRRPQPQHVAARCHFSTVPEACEDCAEGSSGFTTHFCTRVVDKTSLKRSVAVRKDASSQTTDLEEACEETHVEPNTLSTASKSSGKQRRTSSSISSKEQKTDKRGIESSATSRGTTTQDTEKSDSSTKDDSTKHKSRTVHIDVYCTGSDDDDEDGGGGGSSDSSSENEATTPVTVFEGDDVRITHTQATADSLPRGFRDEKAFLKRPGGQRSDSFKNAPMRMPSLASTKGYESDDVLSSLYPSQFSSYSALRDLDSAPWSAASSSTAVPFDDCDSTIATSSKDTLSDIESLMNDGKTGLTPCDSFEYANSSDRERIRRMEKIWARDSDGSPKAKPRDKSRRSPVAIERKHLLRNRKMREYLEKHDIGWSSADDSAADSDESAAVGWSFVSSKESSRLESAVHTSKDTLDPVEKRPVEQPLPNASHSETKYGNIQDDRSDSTTRSDCTHSYALRIGPFGSKSPSPLPSKVPSRVTSPFTTPQGERTEHILKASIFGAVVNAFRKPGHHVGPSKNPSCSCEHCRRYFEDAPRGRSSSFGEIERRPGLRYQNERGIVRPAPSKPKF